MVVGLITKLHRELKLGPGEVTVKSYMQDRGGSARPAASSSTSRPTTRSIRAHKEGSSPRVDATVDQEPGRSMVTRTVNAFRVLAEDD